MISGIGTAFTINYTRIAGHACIVKTESIEFRYCLTRSNAVIETAIRVGTCIFAVLFSKGGKAFFRCLSREPFIVNFLCSGFRSILRFICIDAVFVGNGFGQNMSHGNRRMLFAYFIIRDDDTLIQLFVNLAGKSKIKRDL